MSPSWTDVEAGKYAMSLLDKVPCGMLVISEGGAIVWSNSQFRQWIGSEPAHNFYDCVNDIDRLRLETACNRLADQSANGAAVELDCNLISRNAAARKIRLTLSRNTDSEDARILIDALLTPCQLPTSDNDASAQCHEVEHVNENEQALLQEILHRTKNLLAIIQAMAGQTARGPQSKQEYVTQFKRRIQGLSATHDLLVRYNWGPVLIDDLISRQLRTLLAPQDARVSVGGPELPIPPQYAQPLGLAVHELLANSLAHGCLSVDTGCVNIAWSLNENADAGSQIFALQWVESGGPPVSEPERKGFGYIVTTEMLAQSLGCKVALDYAIGGVDWKLEAPVPGIIISDTRAVPNRRY